MKLPVLGILLLSIALGASGQLLFKAASLAHPADQQGMLRTILDPRTIGGFACFFTSAILWIFALKRLPLSIAYPMVALSYVLIFIGSATLFHETITWRHWLGAGLIFAGILSINLP
jgi:drug/metabolite transporter (DMT)-like permease